MPGISNTTNPLNTVDSSLFNKVVTAAKALIKRTVSIQCDGIPVELHSLTRKKIVNWIALELSVYFKCKRPWGWPTHIQVEPASVCNLECVLCPVTKGLGKRQGYLQLDLFQKTIDRIADNLLLILFWDWGEPFLNPAIYRMIEYAAERNIGTISSSNGHLFAGGHHADRVVDSGLHALTISVDGLSQKTYRKYRQKGDLEIVIEGIKRLVAAKEQRGSQFPQLNLRLIAMKHNEHEIPQLRGFAQSLGVDRVSVKTLNPFDDGKRMIDERIENLFIPSSLRYQRFKYDDLGARIPRINNSCKDMWNSPTLHSNGDICICSCDNRGEYLMGNVQHTDIRSIWTGRPYRELRRQFRENFRTIPICSTCTHAFEGGDTGIETIIEDHDFGLRGKS